MQHLLSILAEQRDVDQMSLLIDKVDENGSGDIEFEELATLLRAASPQLARPREVDSVKIEAHPLIEQMSEIASSHTWSLMSSHPAQLRDAAARAKKLAVISSRLSGPVAERVDDAIGWRRTLSMITEVGRELMVAAAEGERRGSLTEHCDDSRAHALAQMAQAMHHACAMLAEQPADSYEVHVALRTVRTVEQIERVNASKPVQWRNAPDANVADPADTIPPYHPDSVESRTSARNAARIERAQALASISPSAVSPCSFRLPHRGGRGPDDHVQQVRGEAPGEADRDDARRHEAGTEAQRCE